MYAVFVGFVIFLAAAMLLSLVGAVGHLWWYAAFAAGAAVSGILGGRTF